MLASLSLRAYMTIREMQALWVRVVRPANLPLKPQQGHHGTGWQSDVHLDSAAHAQRVAHRLGVTDGGAAIRSSALKKLEGDATVDGAQRAKVSVRPPYCVGRRKRATDVHLALVSMCCH